MAARDIVEEWKTELGQAGVEGLADGLRQHLPVFVGLVLIGPVVCGLIWLLHLVLGDEWAVSAALGVVLGAAGVGTPMAWFLFKKRRRPATKPDSREWAVLGSNQ